MAKEINVCVLQAMLDHLYGSVGKCLLKMELNGLDFQLDLALAAHAYELNSLEIECRSMIEARVAGSLDECLKIYNTFKVGLFDLFEEDNHSRNIHQMPNGYWGSGMSGSTFRPVICVF